jgi:two-component system NtrC family sensor kinase
LRENQKLVTIGRLTASIAHEINNPLESVTNLLYLLDMVPNLPDAAHQYLDLAQKELGRVVQIARQTLNFYRETAAPVRTHLSVLLDEVLVLYSRRIAEKKLEVVRQFIYDEPVMVYPGEMRQVFSNLVTNAIEASSPGGKLRLRTHRTRQWSDHEVIGIRVSVADTGTGIDRGLRHRLGEPFFTTKGQRGTGLGLWVTQSIIRRYGGNLQLHSSTAAQHHGTVFSVFLPTNMRPHAVVLGEPSSDMPSSRLSDAPADKNGSTANPRQVANGD